MAPIYKRFSAKLFLLKTGFIFLFINPGYYGIHAQVDTVALKKSIFLVDVDSGWAKNSVNAVIFRKNSLVTHKNVQYIAYYDPQRSLVIAKRKLKNNKWNTKRTKFTGDTEDAHNSISIMVDGDGYLHVAWNHHNDTLRYAKSVAPGSLTLSNKIPMTGLKEDLVTYPEFYRTSTGDLYFFYRYGASGNGDLVINKYDTKTKKWTQLQDNLIDGEDQRNAYWQAFVDNSGTIHISWVWRETWDVATNHDMCYARSKDGGKTWENSKGKVYKLPITIKTAEVALQIPQNSELINQTSMTADDKGNPIIATYFKGNAASGPQYQIIYNDGKEWHTMPASSREIIFSLSGGGTKKIPISRPQILHQKRGNKEQVILLFRDLERDSKPSAAINNDFPSATWETVDLSDEDLGSWEPTFDTELWKNSNKLHLFIQEVVQEDAEGISDVSPKMIKVLEWEPALK